MKIQGLFLFLVCQCIVNLHQVFGEITIKNVERNFDLRAQVTKITNKLTVENIGKSPVKQFDFALEKYDEENLSHLSCNPVKSKIVAHVSLASKHKHPKTDAVIYTIDLKDPIPAGKTVNVEVEVILTKKLEPFPKEILQKAKQLVKYTGNLYFYSPYPVAKQSATFTLPSANIESHNIPQAESKNSVISGGPYTEKPPFSQELVTIHFENNNRFLTVTNLERVLEISHWGNIAIEETIDLLHTGALLKGSFSRYEYTRESRSSSPSIQSFDTVLPASASDIYYRDDIGNISTSFTRYKKDSVELNLRPRFPLFGGWKTKYTIGYNVPSYEYLYNSGDEYVLQMRLIDHIYDDMVVDDMVLKIILPEGCSNIEMELPYEAKRLPDSLHYTYLDATGRPVISLSKKNLVENHIQNLKLKYTFPRILMFREPLIVVAALYLLFLIVIFYVRLDFSIDKDEASESRLRISEHSEKILAAHDRRVTAYNHLDEQLSMLKTNKNTGAFLAAAKSINQEYKNATVAVAELSQNLKGKSGDLYEKVHELQKYDRVLKDYYNQQQTLYVDKLIPGKIGRQQFIEAELGISKKKEECVDKINSIIKSMQ